MATCAPMRHRVTVTTWRVRTAVAGAPCGVACHFPRAGRAGAYARGMDDAWVFQQGLCGTYAVALIERHPHLRLGCGVICDGEGDWRVEHFFAHDDQYAYDSLGRHALPYLGIDGQLDGCWTDEHPDAWGLPGDEAGPEGVDVALQRAHAFIDAQQPEIAPVPPGIELGG